jgi:perosamine synthetase
MRPPRTLAMLGSTTAADGLAAVTYLLSWTRLVQGDDIARYERSFAARHGLSDAVSFSAARVGFHGVLGCLGIGPGHEVLLQAPTHAVVVNAIRYRGAVPVYVDCEPQTCNIDLDEAERLISTRTRAILVQHTFGVPADLDRAVEFADQHGLTLIEDCVHSLGATFRDRPIGTFGRAAFFSTEESKIISTTMGGMVLGDPDLLRSLRAYQATCEWPSSREVVSYLVKYLAYGVLTSPAVHHYARRAYEGSGGHHPFVRPSSDVERRGLRPPTYERRLSNAQARLGLRALDHLDANLAHRRKLAAIYASRLPGAGGLATTDARSRPAYVRYPVVVSDRRTAIDALAPYLRGDTWFDQPVQAAVAIEDFGYQRGSCPTAEYLVDHLINLPTHPHVRPVDAAVLAHVVARFVVEPAVWSREISHG